MYTVVPNFPFSDTIYVANDSLDNISRTAHILRM
jgi:hypothetical protein